MDVTPPTQPPPPTMPPPAGAVSGPPTEPPPSGVAVDEGARRVALLAVVAATVLALPALLGLIPLAFAAGAREAGNLGFVLHRTMFYAELLLVLVAIATVLRSRRAASPALVAALVLVGAAPLLSSVMGALSGRQGLPMFGVVIADAVGAWWPALLVLVVLVEVRPVLAVVERSWRTTLRLAVAAGAVGLLSAVAFGVMFAAEPFPGAFGFGAPLVAVMMTGLGFAAWAFGLLAVIHAVVSAVRTRSAADDPSFVPAARPGVGALVVGAVAVLVFVQLGFTVLRYI